MDYRLVEWAFRAHPSLIRDGHTKAPVRSYLSANGLDAIANRPDKLGFPTPVAAWFGGEAKARVSDALLSPGARIREVLDPAAFKRLFAKAAAGDYAASFQVYKTLTLEYWLRACARQASPARPAVSAAGRMREVAAQAVPTPAR
jgi:hypothetical protein